MPELNSPHESWPNSAKTISMPSFGSSRSCAPNGRTAVNNRVVVLREAARKALLLRRSLSLEHPVNAFDVAMSIGVEIQFMDLPSLEGMFFRGPDPKIILPSLKHRS